VATRGTSDYFRGAIPATATKAQSILKPIKAHNRAPRNRAAAAVHADYKTATDRAR
jgi:hypothetical protein